MDIKEQIRRERAKIKNLAMYGVEDVPNVEIDNITDSFTNFQKTKDTWAKIKFPEGTDISACVFRFHPEGTGKFPWHKHALSGEWLFVNQGKIEVHISYLQNNEIVKEKFIVSEKQSFYIPKNVNHKVKVINNSGTTTEIYCIWNPSFGKGWEGDFTGVES